MATTVRIQLLGQEFRLQTNESEAALLAAAALVQERADAVRALAGGTLPPLQQALLAAVGLAGDLRKAETAAAGAAQRLQAAQPLLEELESLASTQAAATDALLHRPG